MNGRALILAAGAAFAAACGGAPTDDGATATFPADVFETVSSTSGQLQIDVRWWPPTPVKGQNAAQLTFHRTDGVSVDGVQASVLPWMPAHGHGTSIQPQSTIAAPGVVVASPIYLYMPGQWQLRITISGADDDAAVATVEIR